MAKTKCFYNGVSEHDMDLMFLQLFSTDIDFVRLFLVGTPFNTKSIAVSSVELSKTDSRLGESDITVNLSTGKKIVSLLIEDKIDAPAMPKQAERYVKRGKKAIKNGECNDFLSFIVCPQKYYDNNQEARNYPNLLTYEDIYAYLRKNDLELYNVYCQQITQAIEKAKRPAQVVLNEQANAFFRKYKDYQEENYPVLDLRTSRNSNGYWAQYATRLSEAYLLHKIQEGKVDLTFSNASSRMNEVESVADWLRRHGLSDARAQRTGKAGAIHIDVPKLDMSTSFEQNNIHDINVCFEVISELIDTANIFAVANNLAEKVDKV